MSDAKPRRPVSRPSSSEMIAGEIGSAPAIPVIAPQPAPEAILVEPAAAETTPSAPPAIMREGPSAAGESPTAATLAADDAWAAFTASQAALSRGFTEASLELSGLTRAGIAAAADAATAMLGARTFAELVEINAGLWRRRADAMIEGSARLSEISVKALTEASRPVMARLGINRCIASG